MFLSPKTTFLYVQCDWLVLPRCEKTILQSFKIILIVKWEFQSSAHNYPFWNILKPIQSHSLHGNSRPLPGDTQQWKETIPLHKEHIKIPWGQEPFHK